MPVHEYLNENAPPAWKFCGTDGDVVLKSAIFLARNFKDYRFPHQADKEELIKVSEIVRETLDGLSFEEIRLDRLSEVERELLKDKRYILKSILREECSLYIKDDGKETVSVNEDDHALICCKREGLGFYELLDKAFKIDDKLDEVVDYAYDETYGYLTALPSRVGTGLQATAILHLPALSYTKNVKNAADVANKFGLDLRPVFGIKEKDWQGNLFILSNHKTIGLPEIDLTNRVSNFAKEAAISERRGREALVKHRKDLLDDVVWRAYGLLERAKVLTEKEALDAASKLQLGGELGIIKKLPNTFYGEIYTISRASYLRNLVGDIGSMDHLRAIVVARCLAKYKE